MKRPTRVRPGAACPISGTTVDGTAARINGLIVTALLAVALFTPWRWVLALLAIDFAVKVLAGFGPSPISWLSRRIRALLRLRERPIDQAPKKFAAGLGLLFSAAGLVLGPVAGMWPAYYVAVGAFALCAALEGFGGVCVGCQIYQVIARRRPARADSAGAV